jgi:hypothetical protein
MYSKCDARRNVLEELRYLIAFKRRLIVVVVIIVIIVIIIVIVIAFLF